MVRDITHAFSTRTTYIEDEVFFPRSKTSSAKTVHNMLRIQITKQNSILVTHNIKFTFSPRHINE